jgi:hypothetical protein
MAVLHTVIYWIARLLVCGVGFVAWIVSQQTADVVRKVRSRRRHHRNLWIEQYHAEQAIRSIRREAIRDMLEAECIQRRAYDDPDIIEGTAVVVDSRW